MSCPAIPPILASIIARLATAVPTRARATLLDLQAAEDLGLRRIDATAVLDIVRAILRAIGCAPDEAAERVAEALEELTTFSDLSPGDLVLTGTPAGCALRVPPPPLRRLMQLLPERVLWKAFVKAQQRRPSYLQPGDRMTLTISSANRRLDLGEQQTIVRAA